MIQRDYTFPFLATTTTTTTTTTSVTDTINNVNTFSEDSTSVHSTVSSATSFSIYHFLFKYIFLFFLVNTPASFFVPRPCPNQTQIGVYCNISSKLCDMLKPCQNNGTCNNTNTTLSGYICSCPSGFNGTNCEINIHPCQSNTCWNNGIYLYY